MFEEDLTWAEPCKELIALSRDEVESKIDTDQGNRPASRFLMMMKRGGKIVDLDAKHIVPPVKLSEFQHMEIGLQRRSCSVP